MIGKRQLLLEIEKWTKVTPVYGMFIRMVVILSQKTAFNLRNVLRYPITLVPLSLAQCDGTPVKTNKATLLHKIESFQTETISHNELPHIDTGIINGGLLLYAVLSQTNAGASYSSIARTILLRVCSEQGNEVHVYRTDMTNYQ